MESRLRAEFDDWYVNAVESNTVDTDKEREHYWASFCADKIKEVKGEVDSSTKGRAARLELAEERREQRELQGEENRVKSERVKELKAYGKSIPTIDGTYIAVLREWI
jgi:hypothetical protein